MKNCDIGERICRENKEKFITSVIDSSLFQGMFGREDLRKYMFSQDRTIKIEKEEIEEERYGIGVGRECGREERKKISQL